MLETHALARVPPSHFQEKPYRESPFFSEEVSSVSSALPEIYRRLRPYTIVNLHPTHGMILRTRIGTRKTLLADL